MPLGEERQILRVAKQPRCSAARIRCSGTSAPGSAHPRPCVLTGAVVERFFGSLKYEHLHRADIGDGDALAVEVHRFRHLHNTIRPHQALADRTPAQVYTAPGGGPGLVSA
jgi:transposase InsO family protein